MTYRRRAAADQIEVGSPEHLERIIRPAAIVPARAAAAILTVLEGRDVSYGGVWNATASLWQRYDRPWDGPAGSRGTSHLVGSIAVVYDQPMRHQILIYKVTVTEYGAASGWTVDRLCDDALSWGGLTLDTCPRADLQPPPPPDPFHLDVPAPRTGESTVVTSERTRR